MGDARPQTWVAMVEIKPGPEQSDVWTRAHDGQGGAIVWAAGRAVDEEALRRVIVDAATERGWLVHRMDDVAPWRATGALSGLLELVAELEATTHEPVVWGPLQTYPNDDLSDSAFLAQSAGDEELTVIQSEVVATLSDMLARLDLPRLDGSSFHVEDDDAVVVLSPVDDRDPDLAVTIGERTVDVDYGWAHETFDVTDDDGLDVAYQFLYSALQGGVKVEVFRSWGRVRKVHTHVLMEGETWQHAYTMSMFIPPGFRDPPPTTHLVGFS